MAYPGKRIRNYKSRQTIEFITTAKQSKGEKLEMISTWGAYSTRPVPHYHPLQEERFTVIQGELTVQMGEDTFIVKKGHSLDIPKNTAHCMWNNSDEVTMAHWTIRPALQTEYFLETGIGLENDGKTNSKGMPGILQVALMARHYRNEFRVARPAYLLQRLIFGILTPFALLAGKRAVYRQYLD